MKTTPDSPPRGVALEARAELGQKKIYTSPELTSWGSIVELTKGPINGTFDGGFSGTGGT